MTDLARGATMGVMSATPAAVGRFSFARSRDDRVLAGVAGGLAERIGVDALAVRAAFVLLTVAGGAGIALYLIGLALATPTTTLTAAPVLRRTAGSWSVLCFTLAALLVLRRAKLWIGDTLAWPVTLLVVGSLVVWLRRPDSAAEARRITDMVRDPPRIGRIVVGLSLSAAGVGALSLNASSTGYGAAFAAVAALIMGLIVTAGPWVLRVGRELADERRQRIRSEEKAALSAHLHDSVLQTLTLIQRQAHDPDAITRLARRQEHELRDWLYGRERTAQATLAGEIRDIARDVEATHGVSIDVVQVGDAPVDTAMQALTEATREALVNAAKHSGVPAVSLFVEVEADETVVYVRDRGHGFDPTAIAEDRVGIRESIRARLTRAGGMTVITAAPGEGTEIEMRLPRTRASSEGVS